MNPIHTSIDIDAPAETVWAALTDFAAYPEWNPRSRISGVAAPGERLVVAPGPDAEGMPTFRPRVLTAGPVLTASPADVGATADETESASDGETATQAYELRWLGHLWVRGLFDGEHAFRIEPLADDRSRLTQSESFSGVLAGLLLRRYGADTESGFRAVNEALKAHAEAMAATRHTETDSGLTSDDGEDARTSGDGEDALASGDGEDALASGDGEDALASGDGEDAPAAAGSPGDDVAVAN
ncbi:MAG: SRPBCC family protein [Haloglomus sp.]